MSFFDDAGAWFDQAGKDAGQGFKDVTNAVFNDGPKNVMNELATGDVMQGIWNAQDDFSQVVYDVFNPANGPSADEIVDQIDSQIPNNSGPSGDEIIDLIDSQIPNNSGLNGDGIVDQIESQIPNNSGLNGIESQIGQQSTSVVHDQLYGSNTNDYVIGTEFNNPAPELPSPVFETFDPLTNPNPGLSSAFEFSEVRFDAVGINSNIGPDVTTIEELPGLVGGCGYDSIDSMKESQMDSMNSIFEVADIPMF